MKQKFYFLITFAITMMMLTLNFGCGSSASTEPSKTGNAPKDAPATKNKSETSVVKQSTPMEAGESFFNAIKQKDKAAFKSLMSKESMEILQAAAEEKKVTLDGLLDTQFFPNTQLPEKCEQRNEKITGDKATTEMKDEKGEWSPMAFVKEDGVWKVSLE